MENKLLVIDVSHGTTHDGPGMRTTVFTKGCSLRCQWCQNPESISIKNQTWWSKNDCIGCLSCVNICPNRALEMLEEGIVINRDKCQACGNCVAECPSTAMAWQGMEYDFGTLLEEVLRDKLYYRQFQGGVTCSGGEPLLQSKFIAGFFCRLKEEGISTAIDTCGFVPKKNIEEVLPYTDYILYDLKIFDSVKHKQYTGASNEIIFSNLLYIADFIRESNRKMEVWIRTPLIPNVTADMDNIQQIGEFIRDNLSDVVMRWELCAFNGLCASKYEKMQEKWMFEGQGAMIKSEVESLKEQAKAYLGEKVILSGMIREI